MRFSSVLLALPLAVIASPVLEARAATPAGVLADLKTLTTDITKLNTDLNAFGDNTAPTTTQLVTVVNDSNTVQKQINTTTSDANGSAKATAAQSTTTFNYLNGTVYPDTVTLLNNFIAHVGAFTKAGVKSTVHSQLQQTETLTQTLSTALINKSTGAAVANGKALSTKFTAAFNKAVAAYA